MFALLIDRIWVVCILIGSGGLYSVEQKRIMNNVEYRINFGSEDEYKCGKWWRNRYKNSVSVGLTAFSVKEK